MPQCPSGRNIPGAAQPRQVVVLKHSVVTLGGLSHCPRGAGSDPAPLLPDLPAPVPVFASIHLPASPCTGPERAGGKIIPFAPAPRTVGCQGCANNASCSHLAAPGAGTATPIPDGHPVPDGQSHTADADPRQRRGQEPRGAAAATRRRHAPPASPSGPGRPRRAAVPPQRP